MRICLFIINNQINFSVGFSQANTLTLQCQQTQGQVQTQAYLPKIYHPISGLPKQQGQLQNTFERPGLNISDSH